MRIPLPEDSFKVFSEGSLSVSYDNWAELEALLKSQDTLPLSRSQSLSYQPHTSAINASNLMLFPANVHSSGSDRKPSLSPSSLMDENSTTRQAPPMQHSHDWAFEHPSVAYTEAMRVFDGPLLSTVSTSKLRADWAYMYDGMLPPSELSIGTGVSNVNVPNSSTKKTVPASKRVKAKPARPESTVYRLARREYVEPTDDDVLMGRGGRANQHPGNKRYLAEKEKLRPEYVKKAKHQKNQVSQKLVDSVHAWGGRFIRKDCSVKGLDRWFIASNEDARKKASQALREENTEESREIKRQKWPADKKNKRRCQSDSDDSYCE